MSQRELCYQDLVVSVYFDNRLDRDAVLHVRCPVRTLIFSVAAGLGYHRSDFVFLFALCACSWFTRCDPPLCQWVYSILHFLLHSLRSDTLLLWLSRAG